MKAKLTIKNPDSTNIIIFDDVDNKRVFSCFKDGVKYNVDFSKKYIIKTEFNDHKTIITINKDKDSNIEIVDKNGSILVPIKVLAIKENNGMISFAYKINDDSYYIDLDFIQ